MVVNRGSLKCPSCPDSFRSQEAHFRAKHKFPCCSECGREFGSGDALEQHYNTKHRFKCSDCDEEFTAEGARNQHYEEIHRWIQCPECDRKFLAQEAMDQHYNAKHRIKCPKCNLEFTTWTNMYQHHQANHPIFKCPECGCEFNTEEAMNQHYNAQHRFECPECDEKFTTQAALNQHYDATHHMIACPGCDRKFGTKVGMEQHRDAKHSFKCSECDEKFYTPAAMNRHFNLNHRFECTHCFKFFITESAVIQHREENHRFQCAHCLEVFVTESERNQHDETKHNFRCPVCSEKFATSEGLRIHEESQHKTYPCPKCPETFKTEGTMNQHVDREHKPPPPPSPGPPLDATTCEYCLAGFPSPVALRQHKVKYHNWKPTKSAQDGIASQTHSNAVHAVTDTKGKVATPNKDVQQRDASHRINTEVQNVTTQSSLSSLAKVNQQVVNNPPSEVASSVTQDEVVSFASDDKPDLLTFKPTSNSNDRTIHADEHGFLSSKASTLSVLVEIEPELHQGRTETTYEIASDIWSPATTTSSTDSDDPEEEHNAPDSPTSTTESSQDIGRDSHQGDLPHDLLRTRRSRTGSTKPAPEMHFECRICLSAPTPTSNLTATHCGHLFCYECIAAEVLRTSRCPVCKNVLAIYCLFKLDVVS